MEKKISRGYKDPTDEITDMGVNPFMLNYRIPVNKKFIEVTNKFGVEDELENTWDAGKCCKLYEYPDDRSSVIKLSVRSKEMLLYIIHSIKSGDDFIWIDRKSYMANMGISSINTFKAALNPLIETYLLPVKGIKSKDVYWVNPARIFRGGRINKFPDKLDVKHTVRRSNINKS